MDEASTPRDWKHIFYLYEKGGYLEAADQLFDALRNQGVFINEEVIITPPTGEEIIQNIIELKRRLREIGYW